METYKKITQCVKCGHQSNIMGSPMIDKWGEHVIKNEIIERIRRECPNCHYYWYEIPLDQKGWL